MTNGNGHDDSGPEESGPILLPESANCGNCHYSKQIPMIDPNTRAPMLNQKQRICQRVPPSPTMIIQGNVAGIVSLFPVIQDDWRCFEWDEREGGDVIPTGLLIGNDP